MHLSEPSQEWTLRVVGPDVWWFFENRRTPQPVNERGAFVDATTIALEGDTLRIDDQRWSLRQIARLQVFQGRLRMRIDGDTYQGHPVHPKDREQLRREVVPAIREARGRAVQHVGTGPDDPAHAALLEDAVALTWTPTGFQAVLPQTRRAFQGATRRFAFPLSFLGLLAAPLLLSALVFPVPLRVIAAAIPGGLLLTALILAVFTPISEFWPLALWRYATSAQPAPPVRIRVDAERLHVGRHTWALEHVDDVRFELGRLRVSAQGRVTDSREVPDTLDQGARWALVGWIRDAVDRRRRAEPTRREDEQEARRRLAALRTQSESRATETRSRER